MLAQPSYAYLDPGTGSALIQGLIATVAAVGVTLKLYWHRFVGLFSRSDAGDSDNDASTGKSPD
ncbi:MAG: hypothetical protein H6993_09375 [Pseudomonadales bacterium]|nr:hypothetical protein [Pseudomonadales bacterium]